MLFLASVSSQCVGECYTLTYIKSCGCFWLSGHNCPQYVPNISLIVCVLLALDS